MRILLVGWLISFLGSLPLGTMNIAAIRIAVYDGRMNAFMYASGSLLAELLYVHLVLVAMSWVQSQHKLFRFLEWITLLIIIALAFGSIIAATRSVDGVDLYGDHTPHPFFWGLLLSITNPLHIPFWLGWTTILVNKKVLPPVKRHYRFYMTGIAIGTINGFAVFIYGGRYFAQQLKEHQQVMSAVVGMILLVTAAVQGYKIVNRAGNAMYKSR